MCHGQPFISLQNLLWLNPVILLTKTFWKLDTKGRRLIYNPKIIHGGDTKNNKNHFSQKWGGVEGPGTGRP